jgi:hypothetical protein
MEASSVALANASRPNTSLVVGLTLWVLSWFVPVVAAQDVLNLIGSQLAADAGPEWLPGWVACRFAFGLLERLCDGRQEATVEALLCGFSCLGNVLMLLAAAKLAHGKPRRGLGVVVLLCAGLAASWFVFADEQQNVFRSGYYIWTLSFLLVGLGLMREPKDGMRG